RARRRLRLLLFIGNALVLTGFVIAAYGFDVLHASELDTVDTRFNVRGDRGPPKDVVVVKIDDVTFNDLQKRFPFPRSLHGKLIDRLRRDGAKVIAYDVQFTEPTSVNEDNALIDAVDRAHNVVLATTEVDEHGRSNVFGDQSVVTDAGGKVGNASYVTDSGGVIRRMPYEVEKLKSFSVTAAEMFSGKGIKPSEVQKGGAWIDWHGPPGTVRSVSFSRALEGKVPASFFRGKTVVVGASAPSLQDVHATAVTGDNVQAGPEIQAESIQTALDGFPLEEAPGAVDVILIVLLGLVGPVIALRFGLLRAAIFGLLSAVLYTVAVQLVFNAGWIINFLYPLSSLVLGVVGALAVALILDAFERERIRDLFSRFVPESVVDEVLEKADEDLRLGGEQREVTVLFSDIRGFTTFSESRPPEVVINILNRYLTDMTEVIMRHGGTLVAFMGDGIMAVFGAPPQMDDHADRALAAAREMAGPTLDSFNAWIREQDHHDGFRIGIGLNSGAVMAGTVGSEERFEYTVIGDTTNTASRLEGMTKGSGHMIFLADSTRDGLRSQPDDLIRVDEMEVRGRQAKLVVWSVS
ncbi:MAG TPA: adenylate/guanylate cyclase domain-containing protein, partial [Thermoleophilaceae bacterium]